MKRRSFLNWLFWSVSALWGLGFAGIVGKYLKRPETIPSLESNLISVGPLSSLQQGVPRFLPHATQPVWVTRLNSDEVVAVSALCTHYRCILKWDESARIYQCPCHRGSFDSYGNVLAGPPPAPLPKPRVEIRRGEIYVHLA